MPIVFDEISGEIAPERDAGQSAPAVPAASDGSAVAELVLRELQIAHERAQRLIAD